MKISKVKYLLYCMTFIMVSSSYANHWYEQDPAYYNDPCCPLPCAIGFHVYAGMYPIFWTDRGDSNLIVTDNLIAENATVAVPKFSRLYDLPWVFGGQISYAYCCNTNVFVEFNYVTANNKCNFCRTDGNTIPLLFINLDKYKLYSGYVGAHYYFNRHWFDCRTALFLRAKIGFVHHKTTHFQVLTSTTNLADYSDTVFFRSNTRVSGGVGIGLDTYVWCGFHYLVSAEIVLSGGPKPVGTIVLSPADAFNLNTQQLTVNRIGTEISFPITFGIKYTF